MLVDGGPTNQKSSFPAIFVHSLLYVITTAQKRTEEESFETWADINLISWRASRRSCSIECALLSLDIGRCIS